MILSRDAVVSRYRELASPFFPSDHPAIGWLGDLPPFLCRTLLLGEGVEAAGRCASSAYVATSLGTFVEASGLRVSTGDFGDELLAQLPIEGHVPLDVPGLADWIARAMALLEELDSDAASHVRSWCSLVVWLAPDAARPPATVLTSVAIPTLPHCTFLSVKSLRHIPARHVYEGASIYALAENLFHEALHQQLSASLVFLEGEEFGRLLDQCVLPIPWRHNVVWRIDRVAHAAWVYSNLRRIRERALSASHALAEDHRMVRAAMRESAEKLDYLLAALRRWSARSASLARVLETLFAEALSGPARAASK